MNRNRQYFIVGIFVILSTAILVTTWLWFSASSHKNYNVYVSIFHEPVDGITNNSIVKYNGVDVGKVRDVALDSKNPRNIIMHLSILQNVPINADTYAILKSQGITGLSYISLNLPQKSTSNKILVANNNEPYPEIPTHPSLFFSISEQAQSVTNNVTDISAQMKELLDQDNLNHFSNTLISLDHIMKNISDHSPQIGSSIDSISSLLVNVNKKTQDLDQVVKNISDLTLSLSKTTQNVNELLSSMQNNTLQSINTVLLPNLNDTINHINQSSYQLDQLLTTLNQNPSALVRGQAPAKLGPGE